ncbi:MAG: glycosyltransferase family 39 protein [Candidatus Aenigmarchaeota archaeon]|nr:glycosyltransferase family 39 protein [Candidatus Aenigmarchaeota archaeon]
MAKDKTRVYAVLVGVLLLALTAANFLRAYNFEYVDWDGFQYLAYSRSIIDGSYAHVNYIRSPLSALMIFPDWFFGRLEMALLHLLSAFLIFRISYKITRSYLPSLFSAFLYWSNWWTQLFTAATLSDIPAMTLFLLFLYFWLDNGKKSDLYAGIFGGLAFLARFDSVLLLAPFFAVSLLEKRDLKRLFVPAIVIAIPFEMATDYLVFNRFVYTPVEFFNLNFSAGFANSLAANLQQGDVLYAIKKSLQFYPLLVIFSLFSLFRAGENKKMGPVVAAVAFLAVSFLMLPVTENRIFAVKFVPLLAIMSSCFVLHVYKNVHKGYAFIVTSFVMLIVFSYNAVHVLSVSYPPWSLSDVQCVGEGIICTNAPPVVAYQCDSSSVDVYQYGPRHASVDSGLNKTQIVIENVGRCDYLVYFKDYFDYDEQTYRALKASFELISENHVSALFKTG